MFQGLFIDGFAGGGGASTGIAQAIGREVDIAINHNPMAIAIHKANHPETTHYCQDIKALWPAAATKHQPVAGAWFSPDCKEYSKAKGGPVKDRTIRALCWEVIHWLEETQPTVAYLENVEEFAYAAPLDKDGVPIKGLEGREFKKFCRKARSAGYRVKHKILIACHFGAPTSRKRLYMIMRRDGLPIVWPKPTHGHPKSAGVKSGRLLPYRTAAECIDWSIPCPSIFDRIRPLKDATLRRIAHGVMRFVVNAARPFIIPVTHSQNTPRAHDSAEPLRTITTANGGEFAAVDAQLAPHVTKFRGGAVGSDASEPLPTVTANGQPARPAGATPLGMVGATLVGVGGRRAQSPPMALDVPSPTGTTKADGAIATAHLVKMGNGERPGQDPRALDAAVPLGTVTAKGSQFAAVAAAMAPLQNGERRPGETPRSQDIHAPLSPFATGGKHSIVTAHLEKFNADSRPRPMDEPLNTVMATSAKHAQVSTFLSTFNGSDKKNGGGLSDLPLKTVRAGGQHHAVVAAHIEQANTGMVGHPAEKPLSTIVGKGSTQRLVETTLIEEGALPPAMMTRAVETAAFLVKYYATNGENEVSQIQAADRPIDTITTRARFAVVTVTIDAVTYVIVDIGLRMLKPRELARAQGFPDSYVLNPVVRKKLRGKWVERPLTIAEQISAIGNSVCPPVARALVMANQPGLNDNAAAA